MPRIRCRYEACIFLESGYCTSERIELDPEMGCLTFQQAGEDEALEWDEEEVDVLEDDTEEALEWDEEDEDEDDEDEDDADEW